jgi:uncharacterized membrane protein YsdA (DUF1294 family)
MICKKFLIAVLIVYIVAVSLLLWNKYRIDKDDADTVNKRLPDREMFK